jgi:branched-subunit amino acid transport protein
MEMNVWFIMLSLGLLTFLTRLSFIALHNVWTPPELFRRALHYVPVAVLTAILVPELVMSTGPGPLAAQRAAGGGGRHLRRVADKNTVLTVVIGMAVLAGAVPDPIVPPRAREDEEFTILHLRVFRSFAVNLAQAPSSPVCPRTRLGPAAPVLQTLADLARPIPSSA